MARNILIYRNGGVFQASEFCPSSRDLNNSEKAYSVYSESSPSCIVKFVNNDNEDEVFYDFFYEDFYHVSLHLNDWVYPVHFYSLDEFVELLEDTYNETHEEKDEDED